MQHQGAPLVSTLLLFSLCIPTALAIEWNDFTDNFATDLAPLITLFGEQVTRQFLSESLSIWDNIIFAMAPLGLLTAVVSLIRVSGNASLRAFIGRAQESAGMAEMEVLSCTSATTGELFNSGGGIARVFGSPQILEVVVIESAGNDTSKPKFEVKTLLKAGKEWKKRDSEGDTDKSEQTRGLLRSTEKEVVNATASADLEAQINPKSPERLAIVSKDPSQVSEGPAPKDLSQTSEGPDSQPGRHSPNLSLNLGIVKIDKRFTYLATAFGVILQSGVLVFAILTVQPKYSHIFSDPEGDTPRPSYALPFTLTGTILVCTGMFFCGFIIERCTREVVYDRSKERKSKVYWVQPGNQKIGDQVFDSFIRESDEYESLPKYVVSKRSQDKNHPALLIIALLSSVIGFIMQFVGLRALHASVTLTQMGATLLMSIVRAMLRVQRSDDACNMVFSKHSKGTAASSENFKLEMMEPWVEKPETLHGHELDLLALKICGIDMIFFGAAEGAELKPGESSTQASSISEQVLDVRRELARLAEWPDFEVRTVAASLKAAIEGTLEVLSSSLPQDFARESQCAWRIACRSIIVRASGTNMKADTKTDTEPDTQIDTQTNPRTDTATKTQIMTEEVVTTATETEAETKTQTETATEADMQTDTKIITVGLNRLGGTIWRIRRDELEALVGLWALSIHRGNHLEETEMKKSETPYEFYQETVRLLSTLEAGPDETTESDLETDQKLRATEQWCKMWITRRSILLEVFKEVENKGAFYGNNLWGTHFFGYLGSLNTSPGRSFAVQTGKDSSFGSSLELLCAQDIFCFFLEALFRTVDGIDIGGTTETRPAVNQEDTFLLRNTAVEAIADQFQSNGLGKREEAYMCIFPTLYRTGKMPRTDGILPTVIKRAEAYRDKKKWQQAFDLLEWAWYDHSRGASHPSNTAQDSDRECVPLFPRAQVSFGDLCLAAIREEDKDTIRLGVEGICRMLRSSPDSTVSRQYGSIAVQICTDRKHESYKFLLSDAGALKLKFSIRSFPDLSSYRKLDKTAIIRYIVGERVLDINEVDRCNERTAIHDAVLEENIEAVDILLKAKARIDTRDAWGDSPAAAAARNGFHEILQMLIEYDLKAVRASSMGVDSDGQSLLMVAAAGGHLKCVEIILGALPLSINVRCQKNGDNALARTCASLRPCDCVGVINFLLEHGADALNQNGAGQNALHIAADRGFTSAVSAILSSHGVDVNTRDRSGCTALHISARKRHYNITEILMKAGADPKIQNNAGQTALGIAVSSRYDRLRGVEAICGTKSDVCDGDVTLAMKEAASWDDLEVFGYLRKRFPSVQMVGVIKPILEKCSDAVLELFNDTARWENISGAADNISLIRLETAGGDRTKTLSVDRQGYIVHWDSRDRTDGTPLHLAVKYRLFWMVKTLAEAGTPLFEENWDKEIPLHLAAGYCDDESVLELLGGSQEERVRAVAWANWCGFTPLHSATLKGNYIAAKKLIEMGASPDGIGGSALMSPLECAIRLAPSGVGPVVGLLLQKGASLEFLRPLYWVVYDCGLDIVEALVKFGGGINGLPGGGGKTPVAYALSRWFLKVDGSNVVFLLSQGARLTGTSHWCHKKYGIQGETCGKRLGTCIDDTLYGDRRDPGMRRLDDDLYTANEVLAFWKMENPMKTKEDAMEELGGKDIWNEGGIWYDYENIRPTPNSSTEVTISQAEPSIPDIEGITP
ncbi:hypothetical protein TWF281_008209 [Arthrobotrys megalospora]